MQPSATSVCSLPLLVYAALGYLAMRPYATSVCGLPLLVYEALSAPEAAQLGQVRGSPAPDAAADGSKSVYAALSY